MSGGDIVRGLLLGAALAALPLAAQPPADPALAAHEPALHAFHPLLERELLRYFTQKRGRAVRVRHDVLNNTPYRSSLGYPLYYAWVSLSAEGLRPEAGLVRVVAVDRERFEVQSYLRQEELALDPGLVEGNVPPELRAAVLSRAGIEP